MTTGAGRRAFVGLDAMACLADRQERCIVALIMATCAFCIAAQAANPDAVWSFIEYAIGDAGRRWLTWGQKVSVRD